MNTTALAERGEVNLDAARRLIEETDDFEVAKGVVAEAEGWKALLRQIGESEAKQNACAELKLRAIRRAGQLMIKMREPNPSRGEYERYVLPDAMQPQTASQWRSIGRADEGVFEEYLALADEPTYAGLLRAIPKRREGRPPVYGKEIRERAIKLRDEGRSLNQIAELLGVSVQSVLNWTTPGRMDARSDRRRKAAREKRREDIGRLATSLKKAGDPLGEVAPHLRRVADALQVAVDRAEGPSEKARREMLFSFIYAAEDALRNVMQGNSPRAPHSAPSIPSSEQVQ